jgi:[acyl-carrier-protein] S-malonyltransferase
METFEKRGVTAIIEVSPGGTLVGLAKRALPGVRTVALKTPDDLEAARALVTEAAAEAAEAAGPGSAAGAVPEAPVGEAPAEQESS